MKRALLFIPVVVLVAACSEDSMVSEPYVHVDPYFVDWDALPADLIALDAAWGWYGTSSSTRYIRFDRSTRDTATILQVNVATGSNVVVSPDGSNFYFTGYGGSVYRARVNPPSGSVIVQSGPSGSEYATVTPVGWTSSGGFVCQATWRTYDPSQGYNFYSAITIDGTIRAYIATTPAYVIPGTSRVVFHRQDDGTYNAGVYEYNADNGVIRTLLTRSSSLVTNLYPENEYSISVKGGFPVNGGYLVEISNWAYSNAPATFFLDSTLTTLTRTQLPPNVTWVKLTSDDGVVGYVNTSATYPPFTGRYLFYVLHCPLSGAEPTMLLRTEGYESIAFLPQ